MQNQSKHNIYETINSKIQTLESVGADELLNSTLDKLIHIQISKYQQYIDEVKGDLEVFEKKYNLQSEDFYIKFQKGQMGDDMDFMEWSGLQENIIYYKNQIVKLKGVS